MNCVIERACACGAYMHAHHIRTSTNTLTQFHTDVCKYHTCEYMRVCYMSVHVCISMYIRTFTYTCEYEYAYECVCVWKNTHIYVCNRVHVSVNASASNKCVRLYMCMYMYFCACIFLRF